MIMPLKDARNYLTIAVESILSQSFGDFELLIAEDGSTDDSLDIVKRFKDQRIIIMSDGKSLGVAERLNQCIENSRGRYIARMDADDISHPDRLQMQLQFLEAHKNVGICGTQFEPFDTDGNKFDLQLAVRPAECRAKLPFTTPVAHPTVMFNKKYFENAGLRYNTECAAEDYDLWVRASQYFDISNLDSKLLNYRLHKEQITSKNSGAIEKSSNESRRKALDNIKVSYSRDELDLHFAITCYADLSGEGKILQAKNWLSKIANNKWQTVDDKMYLRRECQFYLDDLAQRAGADRQVLDIDKFS
ncbi:glycosyltransferase family 2 protein [Methylobacterium phyllosphaerae]